MRHGAYRSIQQNDRAPDQLNFAGRRASTPDAQVETIEFSTLFTTPPPAIATAAAVSPPIPSLTRPIRRGYGEGEQVYISYGRKSNDELLQFYGFVEADCPADTFVVVGRRYCTYLCHLLFVEIVFLFSSLILLPWLEGAYNSGVMLGVTHGVFVFVSGCLMLHRHEMPG